MLFNFRNLTPCSVAFHAGAVCVIKWRNDIHANGHRVKRRLQQLVRFATIHLLTLAYNFARSKATGTLVEYTKILERNQSPTNGTAAWAEKTI